jgi:hypothetical protein
MDRINLKGGIGYPYLRTAREPLTVAPYTYLDHRHHARREDEIFSFL